MSAKLYYRHGTMCSGKSESIISIANNYIIQGKRVLLLSSSIDERKRAREGYIISRNGMEVPCTRFSFDSNIFDIFKKEAKQKTAVKG